MHFFAADNPVAGLTVEALRWSARTSAARLNCLHFCGRRDGSAETRRAIGIRSYPAVNRDSDLPQTVCSAFIVRQGVGGRDGDPKGDGSIRIKPASA